METEGSLARFQAPSTCPYPEPDQSSPSPHSTSSRSILVLSSHLRLSFPSGRFTQVSPPKPCMQLSSLPYVPHGRPIPFFLIRSLEWYLVKGIDLNDSLKDYKIAWWFFRPFLEVISCGRKNKQTCQIEWTHFCNSLETRREEDRHKIWQARSNDVNAGAIKCRAVPSEVFVSQWNQTVPADVAVLPWRVDARSKTTEKRLFEVFLYWPISLPYNLLRSRKLNDKDTGNASAVLRSNYVTTLNYSITNWMLIRGTAVHCLRPKQRVANLRVSSSAPCTLSVKLSDFTVWRHACAVLTGNRAGLRTVLSSRLSHGELRNSLRESHSFPLFTCGHHDGIIPQMSIAWYIPFQIPRLTPHFTLSFLLCG
jgi:hypothetical protein